MRPFLLKPLSEDVIASAKTQGWSWLEDVCVPWGWTCLTPMSTTGLDSADYLASLHQRAAVARTAAGLPRWERRGIDGMGIGALRLYQRKPSLLYLFILASGREVACRASRRIASRSAPSIAAR